MIELGAVGREWSWVGMCGAVLWDRTAVLKENDLVEILAGHVVAQGLAATVELTDLQGWPSTSRRRRIPGAFDLHILQPGAAVGEVVSTQDGQRRAQRERAAYIRAIDFTPCSQLEHSWLVFLKPSAQPDEVMQEIVYLLADLERLGVPRADGCNSPIMISTPLRALHIRSCVSSPAVGSGGFRLQCPSTWGFGHSGDAVLRACDEFVSGPIGRRKLSKLESCGAADRHLVIVVTPQDLPHIAWALQDPEILPDRAPSVAGLLTGLWVVPMFRRPRAIGWGKSMGWSALTIDDWTPDGWRWG
jgi:hypothetical protein